MRKLFLLQGAPGVGKSTFIKNSGLEKLTIGYDMFRELFGSVAEAWDGETLSIGRAEESLAVKACHEAARSRMHNGETLFIDNTNVTERAINKWLGMAKDFGYQTFLVDMQEGLSIEELHARNEARGFKKVAPSVVDLLNEKYEEQKNIEFNGVVRLPGTALAIWNELVVPELVLDDYKRIVVIGDIQGCGNSLADLFDTVGIDDSTFFIFAGDLFDRGHHPVQVVKAFRRLKKEQYLIVEGNHERNVIEAFSNLQTPESAQATVRALRKAGRHITAEAKSLLRKAQPFVAFTYNSQRYFVTHAGINPGSMFITENEDGSRVYYVGLTSNHNYFLGIGNREKMYSNRGDYSAEVFPQLEELSKATNVIQYFGHRNVGFSPLDFEYIRPLESDVERGGVLTSVILSADGEEVVTVPGEKR